MAQQRNDPRNPRPEAGGSDLTTLLGRFDKRWITNGIDSTGIEFAESFGKFLQEAKFTTSQIRSVFGEVKRIQLKGFDKERRSFLLLRPKVAYAAKRAENKGATAFQQVIDQAIKTVAVEEPNSDRRFVNFCDFFEAILAYHKANGGR